MLVCIISLGYFDPKQLRNKYLNNSIAGFTMQWNQLYKSDRRVDNPKNTVNSGALKGTEEEKV